MGQVRKLCTFLVEDCFCGVDVEKVQEVLAAQATTQVPLTSKAIGGLLNLRGQVVTAIDLRNRMNLPARAEGLVPVHIIVNNQESIVSFLVDEIGDILEVTEESFEAPPETLNTEARALILGVYKLEKRLLHHLDIDRVCDLEQKISQKGFV
jgi:purine-binding chemotaxis protein CheW